jgi:membrane fusion protein (multidrug efflux system)
MKRILWIVAILGGLVIIKLTLLSGKPENKGPKGNLPNAPVSVVGLILETRKLNNTAHVTGSLLANEEVILTPEVSGKIIKLHFIEGQAVSKGQLLVKLNDAELQAQKKKLELQLALAIQRNERLKKLVAVQGASKEDSDAAESLVNQLNADIEQLNAQIVKTEIRAPFSGAIGLRSVSEGAFVTSQTRIAILQQTDPLKIDFFLPEQFAALLALNSSIEFAVQGVNEKKTGRIYAIEPQIEAATRSVHLRAVCLNTSGKLMPGSFVEVTVPLNETPNALMIPTEAIIPILKGQKVFISSAGKAKEVLVETGLRTDSEIQILSGLNPGDTLIISGILALKKDVPLRFLQIKQAKEAKQ